MQKSIAMDISLDTFFESQLQEWSTARQNHEALTRVWCRELTSPKLPLPLRVQCNPARIVSTGASIDKASIAARPCFLCAQNRPEEQHSLDLNDDFEWLVNPFPILTNHYTIAAKQHRPQRFLDAYDAMLQATKILPEGYIVFYNGPKCGASAPDHLHLQAGIANDIPLVAYAQTMRAEGNLQVISPFGYLAYMIHDAEADTFKQLYEQLPVPEGEYEPYMNIVAYRRGERASLLIIPRRAHRPQCYSAEGESRFLISPGTLDMCGLIITPRSEDYERLTATKATEILCEVGVRTEPTIDVGIMQGKEIKFTLHEASTLPLQRRGDSDSIDESQPILTPDTYLASVKEDSITGKSYIILKGEHTEYTFENSTLIEPPLLGPTRKSVGCDDENFSSPKESRLRVLRGEAFFSLHGVTIGKEFHWQQQETQTFQGSLILRVIDGELHAINRIAIEDYLTSVIASEMSGTSSIELLKAHAVISRSWLLAQLASPLPLPRRGDSEATKNENKSIPSIEKYKTAHPDIYALLKENAQEQKRYPTEAEKYLWEVLRAKKLGHRFRRQHIIGDFIVDFICLPLNFIIEVDGKYHNTPKQQEADYLRDSILNQTGYTILRFTNEEVIGNIDDVIHRITVAMTESPLLGRGRGEAIRWYDREAHTHFDVCADDHCQRYQGVHRKITAQVHEAIRATRGIVLSYEGEVCDARFSKCCGGITELYESCWDDTPHPYLSVVRDPFCNTNDPKILSEVLNHYDQGTDFYRWTVEYTQEELSELVRRRSGFDYGDIIDLIPIERGPSGRIVRLQIVGTKATRIIGKELEIRRTLSETHLYSSAFEVEKKGSLSPSLSQGEGASDIAASQSPLLGRGKGEAPLFILHGSGWGHGVGLCQIGAAVMGAQGYKFDEILHHYYPEAKLTEWYIDTNNLQCSSKVTVST